MKGLGGLNNIMQMYSKMQQKMEELQNEAAKKEIESSSGGGMVKVKFNGKQELISIDIDKTIITEGDKDMIEDLVKAAVNQGIQASQNLMKNEMGKLTGDLGIPGLPNLF